MPQLSVCLSVCHKSVTLCSIVEANCQASQVICLPMKINYSCEDDISLGFSLGWTMHRDKPV